MAGHSGKEAARRRARQARQRQQRVASANRITEAGLRRGLQGPGSYTLRMALPGEGEHVRRLLGLAKVEAEDLLLEAIEEGVAGQIAWEALVSQEHRLRAMSARLREDGGLFQAMRASAVVLVAVHPDFPVPVGTIVTNVPGMLLTQVMEAGAPLQQVVMVLMAVTKIPALAVDPAHRGAGLGGALLQAGTKLAHQTGYSHAYGQIRDNDGLAGWYEGQGYAVLPAREGLDLTWLIDAPIGVKPGPGERLFLSTRAIP